MDQSKEMFPKFNEIKDHIAIRSVHPIRNEDNPLFTTITVPTPIPITITDFITGAGTWHQKFQLFKRAEGKFDALGNQFVGYVGGMDVNNNRLDNFGRQGSSAYHDVHSRVTGTRESAICLNPGRNATNTRDRCLPIPIHWTECLMRLSPENLPVNDDAKAYCSDSPEHFSDLLIPNADHALPFARQGDISIYQNLLRGIREAREYIYLADQYFVPNETTNGEPAYLNELLDAADHCKRLIIISPSIMSLADIPFGHERRADVVSRISCALGTKGADRSPYPQADPAQPGRTNPRGQVHPLCCRIGIG